MERWGDLGCKKSVRWWKVKGGGGMEEGHGDMSMGIHAHDGYTSAWGHMVAWAQDVEVVWDIGSNAWVQRTIITQVQASMLR